MSSISNLDDFRALDPFFRIIEEALVGLAVRTGADYSNHYVSVLTITERTVTRWRDYLDPIAVFDAAAPVCEADRHGRDRHRRDVRDQRTAR
jgi:hypothetical protein